MAAAAAVDDDEEKEEEEEDDDDDEEDDEAETEAAAAPPTPSKLSATCSGICGSSLFGWGARERARYQPSAGGHRAMHMHT
jgi:hypothetical protein